MRECARRNAPTSGGCAAATARAAASHSAKSFQYVSYAHGFSDTKCSSTGANGAAAAFQLVNPYLACTCVHLEVADALEEGEEFEEVEDGEAFEELE